MKKIYTFTLLVFCAFSGLAQKVVICGMDGTASSSSAGDKFTIVAISSLSSTDTIYFTEDEYSDANNVFNSSEGHLMYVPPSGGISANSVVHFEESSTANVFTVTGGGTATAVGSGSWSFSNSDELYAYSASNKSAPWSSITDVFSFMWTSNVSIPSDQKIDSDYPNGFQIAINLGGSSGVSADFKVGSRTNTTKSIFGNSSNWNKVNGTQTLSTSSFVNNSLPIELVGFTAKTLGTDAVKLSWITASELNNSHFTIERRFGSQEFEKIHQVAGHGNSQELLQYSYVDFGIPASPKGIYYRIGQYDFDGTLTYSDIVKVPFNQVGKVKIATAFPNPFSDRVKLTFAEELDGPIEIKVYDFTGTIIYRKTAEGEYPHYVSLDLSSLQSGIYFISLIRDNEEKHLKLVKN